MIKAMEKIIEKHSCDIIMCPFNQRQKLIFNLIDKYARRMVSRDAKYAIAKAIERRLGLF